MTDLIKEKLVLSFIILTGLVFTFLVPPFQKPDEIHHFYISAGMVNNLLSGPIYSKENVKIERRFWNLPLKTQAEIERWHYRNKFDLRLLRLEDLDKELTLYPYAVSGPNFIAYLPAVVGIFAGYWANNPLLSFYLARLVSFLFFFVCFLLSLKILPSKWKPIVVFFGALPMVIHQASGINYDAWLLSFGILSFSWWLKFLEGIKIRLSEYLIFIFCLLMTIFAKQGYWALFLLYFLIPPQKIYKKKLIFWGITLIFLGAIILLWGNWIWNQFNLSHKLASGNFYAIQQDIFFHHPQFFLNAVWKSFTSNFISFTDGLVGIFGWLDYRLNWIFYPLYFGYFVLLLKHYLKQESASVKLNKTVTVLLLMMTLLSVLGIFFGMYFIEQMPGDPYIGIQGRYLLVLVPFFVLSLIQLLLRIRGRIAPIVGFCLFLLLVFANIAHEIQLRYYDYSSWVEKPDELTITANRLTNSFKDSALLDGYLVDKEFTYNFGIKEYHRRILGFEFAYLSNKQKVNIPYTFAIYDKSCKGRNLYWGFLNQRDLKGDGIYTHNFKLRKFNADEICLVIKPYFTDDSSNLIKILKSNEGILIRPLLLRKDIYEEFELSPKEWFTGPIDKSTELYQTIETHYNNFSGVSLLIYNFGVREVETQYNLIISDETCQKILRTAPIDKKSIGDGCFVETRFEPIQDSKDKKFCFSIVPSDNEIRNPITLPFAYEITDSQYENVRYDFGTAYLNGKDTATDLIFKLIYSP